MLVYTSKKPCHDRIMTNPPDDDSQLFVSLMMRHERAIYRYIYALLPSASDVDDVMQETALVLWKKFSDYDRSRNFEPWAIRTAYFQVLCWRKKVQRARLVFSDELVGLLGSEESETDPWQQKAEALELCLAKLSSNQRELIDARYDKKVTIIELAKKRQESAKKLYRELDRMRGSLLLCVQQQIAD